MGMDVPETPKSREQAKAALRSMQGSLKGWLKYRRIMDGAAKGGRTPPVLFRRPTAKPVPVSVLQKTLRGERLQDEQFLADNLYVLLQECGMDPAVLPNSNVFQDPEAAVKLTEIAIGAKCSTETSAPQAQGVFWLLLIPVAGVVLVISAIIKNRADVAKEKERIRCIQSGHCTDYGFWLKVGSIAAVGWLAWDKFGVREAVARATKK